MDIKKTILEQIKPEDLALLEGKSLERKFGREEDNVEVHIFDMNDKFLISLKDFTEYEIPGPIDDNKGYYNEITFNPDNILRKLGLNSGQYKIKVNFQRKKIQNNFDRIFFIDEISPSRTEIRAKLNPNIDSTPLIKGIQELVVELQGADDEYFKDFALNFGENVILTGVNIETQEEVNKEWAKFEDNAKKIILDQVEKGAGGMDGILFVTANLSNGFHIDEINGLNREGSNTLYLGYELVINVGFMDDVNGSKFKRKIDKTGMMNSPIASGKDVIYGNYDTAVGNNNLEIRDTEFIQIDGK